MHLSHPHDRAVLTASAANPDDPAAGPANPGGAGAAGLASEGVVLVVDDEPGILDSLTKIFAREGLRVLTAADGAAGLELLRKHRVGVLITDLMMPRTTGMDLLKAA